METETEIEDETEGGHFYLINVCLFLCIKTLIIIISFYGDIMQLIIWSQ